MRGILYPRVQKEIADPTPVNKPATRGWFNLTERDLLPAFTMRDEPAANRVIAALPPSLWLLLVGGALILLGLRRATRWPREF